MNRRHMRIDLSAPVGAPELMDLPIRHPTRDDAEALATLMLDAYRGTIDADGSETIDDARTEVKTYFEGASGTPMLEHSLVAVAGDELASAVLVTRFEDVPLIAYAMTAARHKGRGLATGLTTRVLRSLCATGDRQAQLFVTIGNTAAAIYEGLGFEDTERPG